MGPANLTQLFGTFITALHILHNNNVLDAYGHLSVRNPNNASVFFMSRNEAPALVSSADDIVEYYIRDASAIKADAPKGFIERYIHSEIYKKYPGVNAVVHSHSTAVIPFSISQTPLKPCIHLAGFLGENIPVFDISKHYAANASQDLLVSSVPLGAALAADFSDGTGSENKQTPDHSTVLMQSHGFTTCAASIEVAVFQAVYSQVNAQVQAGALGIERQQTAASTTPSHGGVVYLTEQQAKDSWSTNIGTVQRPWDLWVRQVRTSPMYVNALDSTRS